MLIQDDKIELPNCCLKILVNFGEEALRCVPSLVWADKDREILRHVTSFNG